MQQIGNTHCRVTFYAPNGHRFVFEADEVATGLLGVDVQKDMNQAVGAFAVLFDGRLDKEGRRWDERIPRRSLVYIAMARDQGVGQDDAESMVMIGLTDLHTMQESYSEAAPRRRSVIRGREISCVILDARLWFHASLAARPEYGTLNIASQSQGELQLALVADPKLVQGGLSPIKCLQIILDRYLFVGGEAPPVTMTVSPGTDTPRPQAPLLTLDLPGRTLGDLLKPQYERWSLFEDGVTVPMAHFPARVGSLWNYLHLFIDRAFQEFFTRIEGRECRIYFRGKPFRHAPIETGSRFKTSEQEPTLETLILDPADILAQSLSRDTTQVYNAFLVLPRGYSDEFIQSGPRYLIQPQVIKDPEHPSYVRRYGVQLLEVESMYLTPLGRNASGPPPSQAAAPQTLPPRPVPGPALFYAAAANQMATDHGIPPDQRPWFVSLIQQESSFNPNAEHTNRDGSAIP